MLLNVLAPYRAMVRNRGPLGSGRFAACRVHARVPLDFPDHEGHEFPVALVVGSGASKRTFRFGDGTFLAEWFDAHKSTAGCPQKGDEFLLEDGVLFESFVDWSEGYWGPPSGNESCPDLQLREENCEIRHLNARRRAVEAAVAAMSSHRLVQGRLWKVVREPTLCLTFPRGASEIALSGPDALHRFSVTNDGAASAIARKRSRHFTIPTLDVQIPSAFVSDPEAESLFEVARQVGKATSSAIGSPSIPSRSIGFLTSWLRELSVAVKAGDAAATRLELSRGIGAIPERYTSRARVAIAAYDATRVNRSDSEERLREEDALALGF